MAFHDLSGHHSLRTALDTDMAAAIAPAPIRRGGTTPHGSTAVGAADDAREQIGAMLRGFLLPAFSQFRKRVPASDRLRDLYLGVGNEGWMTPLDQLAVGSAPMPLDVSQVELMVVEDRADRFVGYLDAVFPAIAGNIEVTCQRHVRILAGAVQVEDQTN
ncbi:MAG TPA: hypothetical protein VHK65_18085 [Candidatus Dormibacteraeota bacterium]|nr:hypothetical protein [Candidatus Dormibacteraeota bacterium]